MANKGKEKKNDIWIVLEKNENENGYTSDSKGLVEPAEHIAELSGRRVFAIEVSKDAKERDIACGLCEYIERLDEERRPYAVLFAENEKMRIAASRLAVKLGCGICTDVTDFRYYARGDKLVLIRPVYDNSRLAKFEIQNGTRIVSLRPGRFGKKAEISADVILKINRSNGEDEARLVEFLKEENHRKLSIREADIVVTGGYSMGGEKGVKLIEEFADTLGAAVGATRKVVEAGWLPTSCQIGQTGYTISPSIYIGCGVAGAVQHLTGMRDSKIIIAINKDPRAEIFRIADYGIVGDMFEVIPELIKEIKEIK